ncbi:hypothetical protein FIBSPDRAFT_95959 [Athelia psychrophila]|uniref:Uncharacterized protein n=1 Tax=Athelia psychrophila TaxID=1759441 RepID=A0A166DT34_9AGAM|nr:hypothetical protein FIBSPDRAFT_95959 [Fibularhizoctonia sp. CBS 109695]
MDEPSSTTTSFPANSNPDSDVDTSTDTSTNATPVRSSTPTGTVLVPGREQIGTVVAAAVWTPPHAGNCNANHTHAQHGTIRAFRPSPDTSQPNSETDGDGDGDVNMDQRDDSPAPRGGDRVRCAHHHQRRGGVSVEDGIISPEPNDDFAMGAPPMAPSTIEEGGMMRDGTIRGHAGTVVGADATPGAGVTDLLGAEAALMRRDDADACCCAHDGAVAHGHCCGSGGYRCGSNDRHSYSSHSCGDSGWRHHHRWRGGEGGQAPQGARAARRAVPRRGCAAQPAAFGLSEQVPTCPAGILQERDVPSPCRERCPSPRRTRAVRRPRPRRAQKGARRGARGRRAGSSARFRRTAGRRRRRRRRRIPPPPRPLPQTPPPLPLLLRPFS